MGESSHQELEALDHMVSMTRKETAMNEHAELTNCSLYTIPNPSLPCYPQGVSLLNRLNQSEQPHR